MTTPLDLELPADLDELASGRAAVRAWLEQHRVEATARAELLTVASEFLLHAIVKAAGRGSVRLVGEVRPDGVRLAVRSAEPADPVRSIDLPPDPLGHGAIGRKLVESCCDDLRITADDGGTLTECWRRLRSA